MTVEIRPTGVLHLTVGPIQNLYFTMNNNDLLRFSMPNYSNWQGKFSSINVLLSSFNNNENLVEQPCEIWIPKRSHCKSRWAFIGTPSTWLDLLTIQCKVLRSIFHELQPKWPGGKGAFTNYVYRKRWVGSPKISTFCQRS